MSKPITFQGDVERDTGDGTVRASVNLDKRAWTTTRAAAEILAMDLTDYIHDALERQLRSNNLPVADFWHEIVRHTMGDETKETT